MTDDLLSNIAKNDSPKVFMLWGKYAQSKKCLIEIEKGDHLILLSTHPSPLSFKRKPLSFFGCNHFLLANAWLSDKGKKPIDWFLINKNAS